MNIVGPLGTQAREADYNLTVSKFFIPGPQVMNMMGPLSAQQRDSAGAMSMLGSSFALAKHMNDLPTQLATLRAVQAVYTQCVARQDLGLVAYGLALGA